MITPRFSCTQTPTSVVVSVYCPSIRASDVELRADDTVFILHVNPYYLRLHFSHAVLEDENSSAHYDASSGYLTVTLTKEVQGQDFRDLDLLAKLLAPPKSSARPCIEVLDSHVFSEADDHLGDEGELPPERREILEAARNDWLFPQMSPDCMPPLCASQDRPYGFLDSHSGYFKHMATVENDVNELGSEPETCPSEERRRRRLDHEEQKWDEEYYMADYADDAAIQELIAWKHPYADEATEVRYTEEETLVMLGLPRKEYLLSRTQNHNVYLTLVTFLFSYAYEARSTQLDFNSESAWTICTLTAAISALDPPPYDIQVVSEDTTQPNSQQFSRSELLATLVPCYRRSLAFPLYRSFVFAKSCHADVANMLLKGQRTVIRCLLDIKRILDHHEIYHVYSKIWVNDICTWLQTCAGDDTLQELGRLLKDLQVEKRMIDWELEALEASVREIRGCDG